MSALHVWHERAPDGPWFVAVEGEGDIFIGCGEENGRLAHMFAAAKELYDAAHNAAGVLIACCKPAGGCDDDHAIRHAINTLEYALAKARGEA